MANMYRTESSDPKSNAQRNLSGRTHYVDDDTLRYHKARVLSARAVDNGLLFAIVESVALDPRGAKRGFRFVIFDLFGRIVGKRVDLENCFRSHDAAAKALWQELDTLDAKALTLAAIDREAEQHASAMAELRQRVTGA